jgi:WD40 repeat protein
MASGGGDALVALWDMESMVCNRTWAHMDYGVRSVSLSADGAMLAYASEQGELEVLDISSGARLAELKMR